MDNTHRLMNESERKYYRMGLLTGLIGGFSIGAFISWAAYVLWG